MDYLKYKAIYLEKFKSLTSLTKETKDNILKFLESSDFFTAPASTNFHSNFKGGLCLHSLNVAEELCNLTNKLNLKWQTEDSPLLIGLLHDFCKINLYESYERNVKVNDEWVKREAFLTNDPNPALGVHGDRSVVMLLMLRKSTKDFTLEQLACIRYHMGAYMDQDKTKFHEASKQNVNVFYTHVADNLASLKEDVIK